MLGKLLKYELQSCVKIFLPLYVALCALTVFMIIVTNFFITTLEDFEKYPALVVLFIFAFYAIAIALSVIMLVIIVNRFRRTLLGKEGYLMLTLPVSIHAHIFAKIISVIIWGIANTIELFLSLFLIGVSQPELRAAIYEVYSLEMFMYVLNQFSAEFGISLAHITFLYILASILFGLYSFLTIYFSLAFGHMSNKSKFLRSFVAYIVINIALGTIMQIALVAIVINMQSLTEEIFAQLLLPACYVTCAIFALLCALFYFGTWYILKNKLNLE